MKTAFCILCLILNCSASEADYVILDRIYLGRSGHMDFMVPREELRKVSPWEPGTGTDAPLSRNQALKIARDAALAEGLDISDDSKLVINLTKTNPFENDLIKHLPQKCCCWFYRVDFRGENAALKAKFTFLVSMSGAIASKAAASNE